MRGRLPARRWLPLATLALLALSLFPPGLRSAFSFTNNQGASVAVGEPDFVSSVYPTSALKIPSNFAFGPSGAMWIADSGNNRILEEPNPAPGSSLTFQTVLGQFALNGALPTVTQNGIDNPSGMSTDPSGNLWVADTNNNRVLEFGAPFTPGEAASLVLGQANFTAYASSSAPTGMYLPADVTFDSKGNLWVTDAGNNRILEFQPPFSGDMSASLAIGQPSLNSTTSGDSTSTLNYPTDATFDSSGNLLVADASNNRIVEYKAPLTTGMAASLVIGQQGFNSATSAASQSGLNFPGSLAFDSTGNLWVADASNNRVVEFKAPFATGMSASVVLGQAGFTTNSTATSPTGMYNPSEVGFNPSGDLWVADSYNNRLLEFAPPFASGASASFQLGQSDYTSSVFQGQLSLFDPESVAFDHSGDLWAVDTQNNRVLEYPPPLATGMSASLAIGQTSLMRSLAGATRSNLSNPFAAAFDSSGDLWVSDSSNNRVLEFVPPFTTGMNASVVIGQLTFGTSSPSLSPSGLNYPTGVAFDPSGNLWVADTLNSRVLEFKPPFTSGMSASLVIGQVSFGSSNPGTSSGQLAYPIGLTFDSFGNLWVADSFNSRVLGFASPLSSGERASLVIGQPLFTSGLPETTQSGLYLPESVAFDQSGNLWVSDRGNNRVLEFSSHLSSGMSAETVIGQAGYFSRTGTTSQTGLSGPVGLSFDASGNLWLADSSNNRLLEFQGPGVTTSSSTSTSTSISTSTTNTSSVSSTSSTTSSTSTSSTTSTTSSTTTSSTSTSSTTTTSSSSTSSNSFVTVSVTTYSTSLPTLPTTTATSTASSAASSSSTATTTSTVPEFPLGAPIVLITVVFAVAIVASSLRRRNQELASSSDL